MAMQISKNPLNYNKIIRCVQNLLPLRVPLENLYCTTTVGTMDALANEMVEKYPNKENKSQFNVLNVNFFMKSNSKSSTNNHNNSSEDLNVMLENLMSKSKDKVLEELVIECLKSEIFISQLTLKKMFRHYSLKGKPDTITMLQKYCLKVDPYLYRRNGEFIHYVAKAHCIKGNPEKGLSIFLKGYIKFENMRSLYRFIFRELIQDSVLNGSEATLVIFRKYVLQFSNEWKDHYPLICFWHLCWSSSWFSDQMFSNELLESSTVLQDIVRDKSTAFSITALKYEYNEDAVVRLLQTLLKYKMMTEYAKVLQILFDYKLKNRDLRGCAEIIKNCDTLGVTLPSHQQGQYIKMLITTDHEKSKRPETKTFKLKF